jgi:hypothetical protein
MYHSDVYNIMIGAPSDIIEEVSTAISVINQWSYINSEATNIVLMPLHWSINSYPTYGAHPQKTINKQLVGKSDLMISIFGAKLGTPTDTEASGTVEEINEHINAGKDVMVFFKLSIDDISSVDPQQLQKIQEFKDSIKSKALWCEFSDNDDFQKKLSDKIQLFVNDHWKNAQQVFIPDIIAERRQPSLSEEEKQRLIDWTKSQRTESYSYHYNYGQMYYGVGDNHYLVKEGRENAEWEDFFKRLEKADLIEVDRYNKDGRPIYKLLKAAYDYADRLISEQGKES